MRHSRGSAVRIAEVNARLSLALGSFSFLALVLSDFFLGVREGIAGREHRVTARLLLFLPDSAKFAANQPDRGIDHLNFDQEIANFLQEVVEVVWANHVRQPRCFDLSSELAFRCFRDNEKSPDASARLLRNRCDFAKREKSRAVEVHRSRIGHDQGPIGALQFSEQCFLVWNDAHAPAFGVQDLLHGAGSAGVIVEHKNPHLTGSDRRTSTHKDIVYGPARLQVGGVKYVSLMEQLTGWTGLLWKAAEPLASLQPDNQRSSRDVFLESDSIPENLVS